MSNAAAESPVVVYMPPLVLILESLEKKKGSPLDEAEVLAARARAPSMEMDRADFVEWTKHRGRDLDPARLWEQWQHYRRTGELTYP